MTLPELAVQTVYARIAWGVLLAALLVAGLSGRVSVRMAPGRARLVAIVLVCVGLMWLPGPASPAYWLGLGFQSPSGLLLALCGVALVRRAGLPTGRPETTRPLMNTRLAVVITVAGAVVYADAVGWLAMGLYVRAFAPMAALMALALVALIGAVMLVRARDVDVGVALLVAALLFGLWRLPSGNPLDMVLDPFLWFWALWRLWRSFGARSRTRGATAARGGPAPTATARPSEN